MKQVYVVGNKNDAYGAEDAIDIVGIFESADAALAAIDRYNEKRVAKGWTAVTVEIHAFNLNELVGLWNFELWNFDN